MIFYRPLRGDPGWNDFKDRFVVREPNGRQRWRTYDEIQCDDFEFVLMWGLFRLPEEIVAYYMGAMLDCPGLNDLLIGPVDSVLTFLSLPDSEVSKRLLSQAERSSIQRWLTNWQTANPGKEVCREDVLERWLHGPVWASHRHLRGLATASTHLEPLTSIEGSFWRGYVVI